MAQNEQTDVAPDADPAVSDKPPVEEREPSPEPSAPARIIINPKVFKDKRDGLCVAYNEAFRVIMEMNGFDPQAEPTDKQRKFFSDTAYADDERMLRRTILARICTFDTSVDDPTPEQLQEAVEFLDTVMEIGAPQSEEEQANVQRIRDAVAQMAETAGQPAEGTQEAPVEEAPVDESAAPPVADVFGGEAFQNSIWDENGRIRPTAQAPKTRNARPLQPLQAQQGPSELRGWLEEQGLVRKTQPAAEAPAAEQPVEQPAAEAPAAEQPIEQPVAEQPVEQPAAEQPVEQPEATTVETSGGSFHDDLVARGYLRKPPRMDAKGGETQDDEPAPRPTWKKEYGKIPTALADAASFALRLTEKLPEVRRRGYTPLPALPSPAKGPVGKAIDWALARTTQGLAGLTTGAERADRWVLDKYEDMVAARPDSTPWERAADQLKGDVFLSVARTPFHAVKTIGSYSIPFVGGLRQLAATHLSDGGAAYKPEPNTEKMFSQGALQELSNALDRSGGKAIVSSNAYSKENGGWLGIMSSPARFQAQTPTGSMTIRDGKLYDVADMNLNYQAGGVTHDRRESPGLRILSAVPDMVGNIFAAAAGSADDPDEGKIHTEIPLSKLPSPKKRQDAKGGETRADGFGGASRSQAVFTNAGVVVSAKDARDRFTDPKLTRGAGDEIVIPYDVLRDGGTDIDVRGVLEKDYGSETDKVVSGAAGARAAGYNDAPAEDLGALRIHRSGDKRIDWNLAAAPRSGKPLSLRYVAGGGFKASAAVPGQNLAVLATGTRGDMTTDFLARLFVNTPMGATAADVDRDAKKAQQQIQLTGKASYADLPTMRYAALAEVKGAMATNNVPVGDDIAESIASAKLEKLGKGSTRGRVLDTVKRVSDALRREKAGRPSKKDKELLDVVRDTKVWDQLAMNGGSRHGGTA